jgi:general secretion pathway protein D
MNTMNKHLTALSLVVALTAIAAPDAPEATKPADTTAAPAETTPPLSKKDAKKAARKKSKRGGTTTVGAKPDAATTPAAPKEPELRLNFRGVPLDLVLNYLSEAAGFTIVLETPVKGTVDVWSNQALTKAEAIDLLNTVLSKNGYAALINGRTLTIVAREEAKKRDIPVKSGNAPESIPKNEEMVTQIIPVRNINATQLIRDLQPLIPTTSTVTANEGGNALVMTDTQMNIHRVAEIVQALDGTVSSAASIRVFALKYADAKALATTIKELFQDSAAGGRGGSSGASRIASFFGGGGGPPGFGGGDPRGGGGDRSSSRGSSGANSGATAAHVSAVADEHSNSLIVSGSDSQLATVEQLIKEVDTDVQDLTEIRVFHLKYADPTETADLLSNLFPDETKANQGNTSRFGTFFGGGGPPGFIGGPGGPGGTRTGSGASASTDRQKKQSKVIAVPDARTGSVVVSAAKDLMPQISEMVLQLDSNPAKKQKVFVYSLENANVQEVESVLRNLFQSQNTRGSSTQNTQQDILQNRANQSSQSTPATTSGFGTSPGGSGGQGGGGFR